MASLSCTGSWFKPHCRKREILVIVTGFKWLRCLVQVVGSNHTAGKEKYWLLLQVLNGVVAVYRSVGSNHTTGKEKYWLLLQVLNGFVALYR